MKSINRSNITTRPFTTFKRWHFQNIKHDDVLLTEDGCPLFLSYVTTSINDSNPCGVDFCFETSSLAIELQLIDKKIFIQHGEKKTGAFYEKNDPFYIKENNPTNRDGSYKRNIWQITKHLFYNNFNDPLKLFGIEQVEPDKNGNIEIRQINDKITVANISQNTFGEKIQPNTVEIIDYSNSDQEIIIKDDGFTNLKLNDNLFSNIQKISSKALNEEPLYYEPESDRFGEVISAWNDYLIVGAPMDKESFSKARSGAAHLFKYDNNLKKYRFVRKFFSPFSQNGFSTEVGFDNSNLLMTEVGSFLLLDSSDGGYYSINDRFGSSVDIDNNTLAIGSYKSDLCANEDGSGHVYIYDKYKGGIDHWGITSILEGSSSLDRFGQSISLDGNKIAIGAPGANSGKGKVYIFRKEFYGQSVPTSSYWFTIIEEENFCSNIIAEVEQLDDEYALVDEPVNSFITPEEPSSSSTIFFDVDQTSSVCNILISQSDFPTQIIQTEDIDEEEFIQSLRTDNKNVFDIHLEEGAPHFINGNSIWVLEDIIETNTCECENFGASLSLSGSLLVIGNDSPCASVYLFESKSQYGWVRINEFNRIGHRQTESCSFCEYPDIAKDLNFYPIDVYSKVEYSSSYFGKSVAINNDYLAIGAPRDSLVIPYSGSTPISVGTVYVFKRNLDTIFVTESIDCGKVLTSSMEGCGWDLIAKLYETGSNRIIDNNFGYSLDMDNNRIAVGSLHGNFFVTTSYDYNNKTLNIQNINDNSLGPKTDNNLHGRAFIFNINNDEINFKKLISKHKLKGMVKNNFGFDVALDDDRFFVGAPIKFYGEPDVGFFIDEEISSLFYTDDKTNQISSSFVSENDENCFFLNDGYDESILFDEALYVSGAFQTENNNDGETEPYTYDWNILRTELDHSISGSVFYYDLSQLEDDTYVGNVFYKNGLIVITNTGSIFQNIFSGQRERGYSVKFRGTHTIYENEYVVSLEPGEFNVSTNPTATKRGRIIYDINNDGIFDEVDLDLILRYINKYRSVVKVDSEIDNGLILHQDSLSDESWWNNDILMSESEDVIILFEQQIVESPQEIFTRLNLDILSYLRKLDSQGLLDINGDGITGINDASILLKYFNQKRGYDIVKNNITENSTRRTTVDILEFLDTVTGANNGNKLISDFENYSESSSLDRTGSYLAPFITTIGLYSGLELVAVAKLGQPIKNPMDYPMNFLIKIDS